MPLSGRATAAGTARYARRFAETAAPGHFREGLGLTLSSIGAGTYLGEASDEVDTAYRRALAEAVRLGCNVLDTAVNYRGRRSERAVGAAVADLVAAGEFGREELLVASKGGLIPYDTAHPARRVQWVYDQIVGPGVAEPDDLAGGIHCIAPDYLSQQIIWSLRHTGLHTLDVYYIHNPETQLAFVERSTFRNRMRLAFARLEEEVAAGRIGCYGLATWHGLLRPPMAVDYIGLEILVQMAAEVAGDGHHFKVVQLPLNASMTEGFSFRNQPLKKHLLSAVQAAQELGLAVVASASMAQAQLVTRLPGALADAFPVLEGNPQRALHFVRSLPGVTTALVGMGHLEHVRQNMALAAVAPARQRAERLARSLTR